MYIPTFTIQSMNCVAISLLSTRGLKRRRRSTLQFVERSDVACYFVKCNFRFRDLFIKQHCLAYHSSSPSIRCFSNQAHLVLHIILIKRATVGFCILPRGSRKRAQLPILEL